MDRFDEACDVIVALLTQERSTYAGTYYALADAYCEPKAVQQPHPPICIGGSGEKRTLRTVARVAAALELRRRAGGGVPAAEGRDRRALRARSVATRARS